jgi:hypothetical protein
MAARHARTEAQDAGILNVALAKVGRSPRYHVHRRNALALLEEAGIERVAL